MTTRKPLTATDTREIAEASGWLHALFCIEQDESQFGTEALVAARAELRRLDDENWDEMKA